MTDSYPPATHETAGSARAEPTATAVRLERAASFYHRYGYCWIQGPGYGKSMLDFLAWEAERGVLEPTERGGSEWWQRVNSRLLDDVDEAERIFDALGERRPSRWRRAAQLLAHRPGPPSVWDDAPSGDLTPSNVAVCHWLRYLRRPSTVTWYRAHNASIALGYLANSKLAADEPLAEQILLNLVLYRVLLAQAMGEGKLPIIPRLARLASNPRGLGVRFAVGNPAYYPHHYPLAMGDIKGLVHRGQSLRAKLRRTAFEQIIQPRLGDLYDYTSRVLEIPELARLNRDGLLTYPEETPVAPDLIAQEIGDIDWSAGLQQLIELDA